jgi:enoyl-CoA hydratase/carnithine racemase
VALVDGYCLGNAAELSLACDFRVAGPRLRWGFPEARLGLMAPVSRLLRQVPRGVATRLALGGPWLDSEAALAAGAVDATVGDVTSEEQVAEAVAGLTRATPAGARWTKQAIRDARDGRNREPELAAASLAEAVAGLNRGTDEDA